MRVTMNARINGDNQYTDADWFNRKHHHRISVATKPFSSKIVVHRVQGYHEADIPDSRTVLPDFAAFLIEFTDYEDAKLANIGD